MGLGIKTCTVDRALALAAFSRLKKAMCTYPVLHSPLPNKPFTLYMDASDVGIGAVLVQQTPLGERPIFLLSCKLAAAEQKNAVIEESRALHWAIEYSNTTYGANTLRLSLIMHPSNGC